MASAPVMCRHGKKCRTSGCPYEHLCKYFKTQAGCRYGADVCRNSHVDPADYQPARGEGYVNNARLMALAAAAAENPAVLPAGVAAEAAGANPAALKHAQSSLQGAFSAAIGKIKQLHRVALCVVLDTTGSMKPQIDAVRTQIKDIVLALRAGGCELTHLAFVGYKDWSDGDKHWEILSFTEKIDNFVKFLTSVPAHGGGDVPEDVLGGLAQAVQLKWPASSGTRVIFHIGDAPPHGRQYYEGADEYPNGHQRDVAPQALFAQMRAKNIDYYFGRVNDACEKMIGLFSQHAGRSIAEIASDTQDPAHIGRQVATVVQRTAAGLTAGVHVLRQKPAGLVDSVRAALGFEPPPEEEPKNIRPHKINALRPSDAQLSAVARIPAVSIKYPLPDSLDFVRSDRALKISKTDLSIRVMTDPFARGSMRLAYYARCVHIVQDSASAAPRSIEENIVLKEFLTLAASPENDLARYLLDLETQTVASKLAFDYVTALEQALGRAPPFTVKFLKTRVVVLQHPGQSRRIMSMEKLFRSRLAMAKYTNNWGHLNWDAVNVEGAAAGAMDMDLWRQKIEFLVAFSHFTYHASHATFLVCDLQGIESDEIGATQLVLTDPAIHCIHEHRFGATNLRKEGIDAFFSTHKCNRFCQALRLPMK